MDNEDEREVDKYLHLTVNPFQIRRISYQTHADVQMLLQKHADAVAEAA